MSVFLITPLPTPPTRQDPVNFATRADDFLGALPAFATQANALATEANNDAVAANNAALSAATSIQAINSALNRYTFSTTVTMGDPGIGFVRFNNATLAAVTAIAIDAQSADTGNPNILSLLVNFGSSGSVVKGLIRFTQAGTPSNFAAFNITAVTNNTAWVQLTVALVASSGTFANNANLVMEFHRTGDPGGAVFSVNSRVGAVTGLRENIETVEVIGTNTTAVSGRRYVLTASCTVTLPITPSVGNWVVIQNSSGVTTAVVARNGSNIMSLAENMTLDANFVAVTLVYADATRGWVFG